MLSRKKFLELSLKDPKKRSFRTKAERMFHEKIQNPPAPTEKLKEIVREYGKYAK